MSVDISSCFPFRQPAGIKCFQDQLASMNVSGVHNFTHQCAYDTVNDSVADNLHLGNITLKIEGNLNHAEDGAWTLNANVRGFQDTYDFNASTYRTKNSGTAHYFRAIPAITDWWKHAISD